MSAKIATSPSTSTSSIPKTSTPPTTNMRDKILKMMAGIKESQTLTPEQLKELSICAMKYAGAFIMLIIAGITIYVASTDDKALTEGFFKYMMFLIIPIIIGSALVLPIFSQKMNATTIAMNVFIFFVFILAIYGFYQTKNPESVLYMKYFLYGTTFFGLIVGLAIVYKFVMRYMYNSRGWVAAVFQFVFFIPCLLVDLIEYIKQELKIAPNTTYILFALEFCIVVAYLLIPRLISAAPASTTNVLLANPVFLNTETQIADYKTLAIENVDESPFLKEYQYRRNFSVSFWAYQNAFSASTPITIFRIGNNSVKNGKPRIQYANGKYEFFLTTLATAPHFAIELPIQKWNHFAISYNDNIVNIFVNGNLEKTHKLGVSEVVKYNVADVIAVGSDQAKNNVGAICNVRYYKTPIRKYDVIKEYNLLMYKNPPV